MTDSTNTKITLSDYNAAWPMLFAREAARIRSVLETRALAVHHVGSTAIPGLCAKPIIDMILVVADSSDEANYLPDLQSAGYVLVIREPEWFQHRMLKGPDADVNLHVFSADAPEIERMLRFRDHLCACEGDRTLYAQTKRHLAQRVWPSVQAYADAKTSIILEIMKRGSSSC